MIKAVLFDLDGTLIDSSEGITKSVQHALKEYGIEENNLEELKKFIGPPLWGSFVNYYGFSKEQALEAVDKFRERYNKIGLFECCLYPGVRECLEELKAKGYLVAVASSKPEVTCKRILEYHNVLGLFDEVSGATMDGRIETKEEVLNQLFGRWPDVSREEMVLVGDTIFDIEGANKVGLKSIGVSFGFGSVGQMESAGAISIIDHMNELMQAVDNI